MVESQSQEPDQINKNQIFGGSESFRLLITASSGMGKSKLIENLMTDPSWGIIKKFDVDCIFVFSPTLNIDPCWKTIKKSIESRQTKEHEFVESEEFFSSDLEEELSNVYEELVEKQLEYKHDNKDPISKLMILDDCLLEVNFGTSNSQLAKMLVKMRHFNISIIVVSEYLKSVHPIARAEFNVYITFQTSNSQEIKKIEHEISSTMKSSVFFELYNFCTSQRYSYLMVVFNFPLKYRYFRGLGSEIEELEI